MPKDPFRECFRQVLDDLYRKLEDVYPAAVNSKNSVFLWAKDNRRPLYEDFMAAQAGLDNLWERTDTDTFKGALNTWREAIWAMYKAYAAETSPEAVKGHSAASGGQRTG